MAATSEAGVLIRMSSPTGTTRLLTTLGRYGVRSGSSLSETTSPDAAATPRLPQISPTSSARFSATAGWQSASLERARSERVRVEAEKWRAYASRNAVLCSRCLVPPGCRRRRSAELGEDLVRQVPYALVDVGPLGLARLVGRCDFVPEEVLRGVATGAARVDARRRPDVDRRDRDAVGVLGGGRLVLRRLGAFAEVLTARSAVARAGCRRSRSPRRCGCRNLGRPNSCRQKIGGVAVSRCLLRLGPEFSSRMSHVDETCLTVPGARI